MRVTGRLRTGEGDWRFFGRGDWKSRGHAEADASRAFQVVRRDEMVSI